MPELIFNPTDWPISSRALVRVFNDQNPYEIQVLEYSPSGEWVKLLDVGLAQFRWLRPETELILAERLPNTFGS